MMWAYMNTTLRNILIICCIAALLSAVAWILTPAAATESCNIAYIPLRGTLVTYIPSGDASSSGSAYGDDVTSSEDVTQSIRDADADPSIKAIVLAIDSPGGSPVAGEEIQSALRLSSKPTAALIRDSGDSAAYLAASGAETIFASAFSDVGDIGITQSYTDNSKQDGESGITYNQLSIGKYKDMFSPDKPLTADERALALKNLEIDYSTLVSIVARNRHMDTATVTALSDGSSMTGTEALSKGLVDTIGNIDDVRSYLERKISSSAVICGIDSI